MESVSESVYVGVDIIFSTFGLSLGRVLLSSSTSILTAPDLIMSLLVIIPIGSPFFETTGMPVYICLEHIPPKLCRLYPPGEQVLTFFVIYVL